MDENQEAFETEDLVEAAQAAEVTEVAQPSEEERAAWTAKATLCELLALSFRYPEPALAEAICSGEWLEAARELAEANGLLLPPDFGAEALNANAEGAVVSDVETFWHNLRAEATRLFVNTPKVVVSPYEGIWRAGDDGVQGLLFVNPHSMAVERFLRSCGLGQPEGTNEPLDHVATELEFLQYAAAVEGGLVGEPFVPAADLPGGSAAGAYSQFVEEHVAVWMPRFAVAVCEGTRLAYYRAAARLLAAFLETL